MSHLPDMLVGKAQLAGDIRHDSANAGGAGELRGNRCRIHGGYQLSETPNYAGQRKRVNTKMILRVKTNRGNSLGAAFRAARQECGLTQVQLAKLFGCTQTAVYRWEIDENKPPIEAIRRLASMASAQKKDELFLAAGISEDNNFKVFEASGSSRSVNLYFNPDKLGDPEAAMDYALSLPAEWLPSDAIVKATKFTQRISPFISGELTALVDIARTDPDRLRGCVVAVRTPQGTVPMTLRGDGGNYLLVPLNESEDHPATLYRPGGEWKIVGQVLKWIGDAPSARK